MNLLRQLTQPRKERSALSLDLNEWASWFEFGGLAYQLAGQTTLSGTKEEIGHDFEGLVRGAYKQNGIVFACMAARMHVFAEAKFKFQDVRDGRIFGDSALEPLERPWNGGTTRKLLSRMLLHADLAGNAFVADFGNRLSLLRPDWTDILLGSLDDIDPEVDAWDPRAEVVGYVYTPGGRYSGREPMLLDPRKVAHFAPIPDPEAGYRGVSWLHPVISDILGDRAASTHKLKFFENAATPNLAITLDIEDPEAFEAWLSLFSEKYEGNLNAYKSLILGAGADYKVIGTNFQQLDFKQTVGVSETRIAAAAGVPPVIVGLSEGLQGSSLNAGNYGQARRRFADGTITPLWGDVAETLSVLVKAPAGSELVVDPRGISFMQEDQKDNAEIQAQQAQAIRTLVDGGYKPETVVNAIQNNDLSLLVHSGLTSVQLLPPGTTADGSKGAGSGDADTDA